jgi:uncharacterized membrane protein YsdA (DUF1294 family)
MSEDVMRTLLIIYIIAINLIGFFIMGIDKRRARRRKWRVAEKTLFLIAALFGSVGILTGMYVFRHKTKHRSFTIGIPAILAAQLLLIGLLFSWNIRRMNSPSQAVENELALIQELDSDTIHDFIFYENLMNSHLSSGTIDEDTAEAVRLFFQNFKYTIQNEQIEGDTAIVSVNITNLDMHALAQDLCRKILRESAAIYPESTSTTTSDYYALLRDTLSENTYETVVTTAYFHLQKEESGWVIQSDETLEDELVSGFLSYMNDPDLLPVSEIVSIHLDALKDLSADQWDEYLSIDDVFATYNTDYASQIDEAYVAQLADAFDYEIIKCTVDGDSADVVLRIWSIDMTNVLTIYKKSLLSYASSSKSIRDDEGTFSNETSRLLLEALQENTETSASDVDLTFHSNGTVWEIYFGEDFTNALMGDMKGAIETFNTLTRDSLAS